ncbi:protein NRT1/ PTR FAMILY 5.2-like [Iris pallida]|uniref:Protein NRT1/ PTR FAMILY 5.2-like n=1 Tax=Iris pallida TaxID=29817 RepID=A0AAX6G8V9_IRIPA|nr:protein NRT1/ PTR FAMILY 5.2-like [Iris pallida]
MEGIPCYPTHDLHQRVTGGLHQGWLCESQRLSSPLIQDRGWTACSFVVVYKVLERMGYYGILTNLVLYLTTHMLCT